MKLCFACFVSKKYVLYLCISGTICSSLGGTKHLQRTLTASKRQVLYVIVIFLKHERQCFQVAKELKTKSLFNLLMILFRLK